VLIVGWARAAEVPFFTAWVNRGLDSRTRATVLSSVSQGNALGQLGGGPVFAVIAGAGGSVTALLLGAALVVPAIPLVRSRDPVDEEA
jgi:DHA3 family tetracycline resistance protein-like MFS transporter